MKKKVLQLTIALLLGSGFLSGCSHNTQNINDVFEQKQEKNPASEYHYNKDGELELTDEQVNQILEESGYGDGVDWSKQSDDDPSIPKAMDVTQSRESIRDNMREKFGDDYEAAGMYEKPWWDYIPDSYDLSKDVFDKTENYAGREKAYNNSLMQSAIGVDGFTSGQSMDLSEVQNVADSFIYEDVKDRFKWTANLEEVCERAEHLDVADFYHKAALRPWYSGGDTENLVAPVSMSAYYEVRTVGYSRIGIPQWSGYKFSIDVWEDQEKLVGWVNDHTDGSFMNEKEVYENMGEWDFYDSVEAAGRRTKIVKPKLPNGAKLLKGEKDLSREQYIYTKIAGGSGNIYYYGNGITVDMTFYGGSQGGNFKDALHYCRVIAGNE